MKPTIAFLLVTFLPLMLSAQEDVSTASLSLHSMSAIRPIAGGLSKPIGPPLPGDNADKQVMYTRQIAFQLTNQSTAPSLKAKLTAYKNGQVTIIFDTDFDNNYSNENSISIVDSSNKVIVDCEKGVSINLRYPDSIAQSYISKIKWLPFTCIGLKVNTEDTNYNRYAGALYSQQLLYATPAFLNDSLCMVIQNKMFDLNHSNWNEPMFAIVPKSHFNTYNSTRPKYFKVGDTVKINEAFIECFNYDGKQQTVMLRNILHSMPPGIEPGFYVDLSKPYRTIADSLCNLSPKNKELTLLEFWGTWCGPCLELYPALESLLKSYESVIHYQGVAFDKQQSTVLNYVSNKRRIANQIFVDMNKNEIGSDDLVKQFNISNYPTFVVIDQSGKILLKEIGKEGFLNLKGFLKGRWPQKHGVPENH
jgi:thiol-disulfide isomerase/thioredoxin